MSTKQDFSSKDSIHFTIPGCEENKWKPLEIVEPPKFLNEKSFFFYVHHICLFSEILKYTLNN